MTEPQRKGGTTMPEVVKCPYDAAGELLAQLTIGRWWFGTAIPCVSRQVLGNQTYRWSLWVRLPGNRELQWNGPVIEP